MLAWWGGGIYSYKGRTYAQPQKYHALGPARQDVGLYRALGLGQVFAGICRGAAALYRVSVGVCAAVFATDAKARRRRDHRPVAGYFDRSKVAF